MSIEIVVPEADDYPAVIAPVQAAFGNSRWTEEETSDHRLNRDDYRPLAARVDGTWAGFVADYEFDLTVPGGETIVASGVTMVGVLPTHRRRGIASKLMAELLDRAARRGDPVAVLLAMESSIYGRFGFGVATQYASVVVDPSRAQFSEDLVDAGRLAFVDHQVGSRHAEHVWDAHRRWRPGTTTRRPWTWEHARRDRVDRRGGAGPRMWVVHHDEEGEPDGYVSYRVTEGDERGLPRHVVKVEDLAATTPHVEAVLFRYLCSIDLVHRLELPLRPVDDHLRWRLTDPRQLQVTELGDFLWARILDVPAALGSRTYGADDELVLEVVDRFRPSSGGRFVVTTEPARPGGQLLEADRARSRCPLGWAARCEPTTSPADLTLDASALGSLLLATVKPSLLAEAGRIEGGAEALRRADALFDSTPAPFACTEF